MTNKGPRSPVSAIRPQLFSATHRLSPQWIRQHRALAKAMLAIEQQAVAEITDHAKRVGAELAAPVTVEWMCRVSAREKGMVDDQGMQGVGGMGR